VQVTGLTGVEKNTKGSLTVENGHLTFAASRIPCDVATTAIDVVITGTDSQHAIGGTAGTISMLAPYEGGRALSLFRNKIDVITIEYRDANGGLHRASTPAGQGAVFDVDRSRDGQTRRNSCACRIPGRPLREPYPGA